MNMLTLSRTLRTMALKQSRFEKSHALSIVDAIMRYYTETDGFYEEDAVRVFDKLIDTGELCLKVS